MKSGLDGGLLHVPGCEGNRWTGLALLRKPPFSRALRALEADPQFSSIVAATEWNTAVRDHFHCLSDIIHVRGVESSLFRVEPATLSSMGAHWPSEPIPCAVFQNVICNHRTLATAVLQRKLEMSSVPQEYGTTAGFNGQHQAQRGVLVKGRQGMATVVKLQAILEALEYPGDWEVYLDPETGEIITVTDDDRFYLDDEDPDLENVPDWQRESLEQARRAVESDTLLQLPDRFEIHEWEIMRRFALAQADPASGALYEAIHGTGAFRMFRTTLERFGLRDAWYEYRSAALERIAREWLESHGIAYEA